MRRARCLFSHSLLSGNLLPSSVAPGAAERALLRPALYGAAATLPRSRWWSSPSPAASSPSKSGSVGLAGALSFSLTLVTEAEAKERPSPGLLPKDVVLYQYFCTKVKDIIDKLSHKLHLENFVVDEKETKWRRWVDEHLVHVLSPNIYRTTSEALESFDCIAKHGNFSTMERFAAKYAGAGIMYIISKKLKKKYNITDERAALYEAAETWTRALNGKDFLGGS